MENRNETNIVSGAELQRRFNDPNSYEFQLLNAVVTNTALNEAREKELARLIEEVVKREENERKERAAKESFIAEAEKKQKAAEVKPDLSKQLKIEEEQKQKELEAEQSKAQKELEAKRAGLEHKIKELQKDIDRVFAKGGALDQINDAWKEDKQKENGTLLKAMEEKNIKVSSVAKDKDGKLVLKEMDAAQVKTLIENPDSVSFAKKVQHNPDLLENVAQLGSTNKKQAAEIIEAREGVLSQITMARRGCEGEELTGPQLLAFLKANKELGKLKAEVSQQAGADKKAIEQSIDQCVNVHEKRKEIKETQKEIETLQMKQGIDPYKTLGLKLGSLDQLNEKQIAEKIDRALIVKAQRISPYLPKAERLKQKQNLADAAAMLRNPELRAQMNQTLSQQAVSDKRTLGIHSAKRPAVANPNYTNIYTPDLTEFKKRMNERYPDANVKQDRSGALHIQFKTQKDFDDFLDQMKQAGGKFAKSRKEAEEMIKKQTPRKSTKSQNMRAGNKPH